MQPSFVWSDDTITAQGTAFFTKLKGHLFVMTSSHFLSRERGKTLLAMNSSSMQGELLLQTQFVWDDLGNGGIAGRINDFRDDDLLMPMSRLPAGYKALELDDRPLVPQGERVWLPNKQDTELGHERVEGTVGPPTLGYVEVKLDRKIRLQSQSGSPIISQKTGKVIGILSRGDGDSIFCTPIWWWPRLPQAPETFEHIKNRHRDDQELPNAPKRVKLELEVPADENWPIAFGTTSTNPIDVAGGRVRTSLEKGLLRLDYMDGDEPSYSILVNKQGAVSGVLLGDELQEAFAKASRKEGLSAEQQEGALSRVKRGVSQDIKQVFNWIGRELEVGLDYEAKASDGGAPRLSYLRANRVVRCMRGGKERRCVEFVQRRQAWLTREGKAPDKPNVQILYSAKLELETAIPYFYTMHALDLSGAKPKLSTRFLGFRHSQKQRKPVVARRAPQPAASTFQTLAEARQGPTTLWFHRPAPQSYDKSLAPPAGVQEVSYRSGKLQLKGWLEAPAKARGQAPAVVYLHGGFAFGLQDWHDVQPLLDAGFVVFTPRLRGENGGPGFHEGYFGEVDDAIAAGQYVAGLPNVDPQRVFLAGHSSGAMLAALVAETKSPYRRVAALSGFLDMQRWVAGAPEKVVFDASDPLEILRRDPQHFVHSLQVPITLYAEPGIMREVNQEFHRRAQQAGKRSRLVPINGNHSSMVQPSLKLVAQEFLADK